MTFWKKIILLGILAVALYALLGYHFIFSGSTVKVLKKSEFSLNYTFFSTMGKSNKSIVSIDELRKDGISGLLVRMGKMTEEEKDALMARYERRSY